MVHKKWYLDCVDEKLDTEFRYGHSSHGAKLRQTGRGGDSVGSILFISIVSLGTE